MKTKIAVIFLAVILSVSFMATQASAQKQVIKWRLQSAYPLGTEVTKVGYEWAKAMEEMTGGRLKVEIYAPGAICAVKDILDYLKRGVFECSVSYGGFYTGLIPETDLEIGLPCAYQTVDEAWDAVYKRGLGNIIQEAYDEHGCLWYPWTTDTYYHFMTNFPVRKLEDLRGKKIRALGIYGKYVERLGGAPVVVPSAELYMSMKLGTIDGMIYGATGLKDIKLNEVVKYLTYPTAAQICGNFLIGKSSLKKLPADLQPIVEYGTKYALYDSWLRMVTLCKEALVWAEKQGTTQHNELSHEELMKMRKLVAPLWDELAAKSPRMKKGIEILKQQMRDLGRPMD